MHRVLRSLSFLAIIMGVGLLLSVGAVYSYSAYERYRFWQAWAASGVSRPALGDNSATVLAGYASPDETGQRLTTPDEDIDSAAAPPVPTPRTPIKPAPATWIRIPKIEVDSPVVHATIQNGEWQVPKFVVGHLEGTADLNENGNVVLTGHVESLASGNVFSRLKDMAVNNTVVMFAGDDPVRYSVTQVKVVKNDDLSVVARTPDPSLTLMTCTGQWNSLTRDFSERLVVVASPTSAVSEAHELKKTHFP